MSGPSWNRISFFDGEELGRYVFDGTFTGHAFGDFLIGMPHFTGYILPAPDVNPFSTYYAFFAQDSWRPSRKVTIDLGLRYDLRPPMTNRSNQLGNFDTEFPGGRVIVSDAEGLALVPSSSSPVGAEYSVCHRRRGRTTQDAASDGHEQHQSSPRHRVAADREDGRTVVRGGVRLVHGAAPRVGQLLDGGHGHCGCSQLRQQRGERRSCSRTSRRRDSAEGALPPGYLVSGAPIKSTCAIRGRCSGA